LTVLADQNRTRRQLFAAPGGAHDKLVRVLSVVLPAAIGALLAVMILAPLSPRGEISFLLDRNKVAVLQDRLSLMKALYRGQDDRGRSFSVNAGSAVQHSVREDVVQMRDITARVMQNDGPAILTTDAGAYDFARQFISVAGLVNFETADGYRMVTRGASINMGAQRLTSMGRVEGRTPTGTFVADRIMADLEARTVTLDGHARLRMEPGKMKMP
jgi:lipopolysaccharide export system protein LptC